MMPLSLVTGRTDLAAFAKETQTAEKFRIAWRKRLGWINACYPAKSFPPGHSIFSIFIQHSFFRFLGSHTPFDGSVVSAAFNVY